MVSSPPQKKLLTREFILSLVIAGLMAAVCLVGLSNMTGTYPTEQMLLSLAPNDPVNLLIGLPALLFTAWLGWRGKPLGLLLWPGALLYVVYAYVPYLVVMPFNLLYVGYLLLVLLSILTLFSLAKAVNHTQIQALVLGKVAERFGGGVLAAMGLLFGLRAIGGLFAGPVDPAELPVLVADLVISPIWMIAGVLLWRKRPFGYFFGGGALFQGACLFIAVIIFLPIQSRMFGIPLPITDLVVLAGMSLLTLIPFGLFVRGVLRG